MSESVYIHIPFCKSKCYYCSFVSFCSIEDKSEYLKSLKKEILSNYENETLKTLYIGGGTPSILTPCQIGELIKLFKTDGSTEITVELNPEDIDYNYLNELYNTGVNRLSFGCQTFNDDILKKINRRHNSKQVLKTVENAYSAGFTNLSLDFIYGLPSQTVDMFIQNLQQAAKLNLAHISLYGLKIEEGCYFFNNPPQNLPDDDTQADMYIKAVETLSNSGYKQYEVSNFSKDGLYSKHNMNYWNNGEYYGFGIAAHGYKNGMRYENFSTIKDYMSSSIKIKSSHILTTQEKLEEEIFLGLRKTEGINVASINKKYSINFENRYNKILEKYLGLNLLEKTSSGYKLTLQGVLVSNVVLADFLE